MTDAITNFLTVVLLSFRALLFPLPEHHHQEHYVFVTSVHGVTK